MYYNKIVRKDIKDYLAIKVFSLQKKSVAVSVTLLFLSILAQKNPYKNCTEYFAYYIDIYAYIVYNPYRVEIPDKDYFRSLIYLLNFERQQVGFS